MISIGLDPSLTGFGWAVLVGGTLTRAGVWSTSKGHITGQLVRDDTAARFALLARTLVELVREEQAGSSPVAPRGGVVRLFVEALPVMRDRFTTAIGQGRLLGVIDGVSAAMDLQLVQVDPSKVKRIGNPMGPKRKVEKSEVRDAIFELYPNARAFVPLTDKGLNVSDAIAVAHCGAQLADFRAQLQPNNGGGW